MRNWKKNPVQFVTEVFGVTPDPFQEEALNALATGKGRVSVRSGHGVGKSALDAWAIIWFMLTHYPCKVPCTAPTSHQLQDILWSELAKWYRKMPEGLREQYELKNERYVLKSDPEQSFAVARTARKEDPEALQGFHAENLLFIIDECSGVSDVIFEVAEGALSTPNAKVLLTSNPTRTSGYFYDSHHKMRDRWHTIKVSCEDSNLVSEDYIKDMATKYGVDSNIYRVRVLGEFPSEDDDAVLSLDSVESAIGRQVDTIKAEIIWGLDVARFGNDNTALAKRKGNELLEPVEVWSGLDTMEVAGRIKHLYDNAWPPHKPASIQVDVIGIGAGVLDRLKELGLPASGVNVAESPSSTGRYMRLRDELWFKGKEWFEGRDVKIPQDDQLIAELTQPKYKFTSAGKLQVESKEELKSRGVNSPDRADAFLLTFAQGFKGRTWNDIEYPDLGVR